MVNALIEYLTVLLEYIDRQKLGTPGPFTPKFGHVTALYTRVSAKLKVLSLDFNTPLIVYRRSRQTCRQTHVYNTACAIKSSCISKNTTQTIC